MIFKVNAKTTIRKILLVFFWVCISGGMLTLLIAAIGRKNKENCRDYSIVIRGAEETLFVDAGDIAQLLKNATGSAIKGKKITDINLRRLEQLLRDNIWIQDAEMWFDNRNVLHVQVTERQPVARIFTTDGTSFYLDSAATKLPLSEKVTARVPMISGFPGKKNYAAADSELLQDVTSMALYIKNNSFWMSQVAQVHITPERNFEISPVVGNHLVKLGNGKNIEKKFNRLLTFYRQVMAKTGFDAYSTVDVQYSGQVVAAKKGKGNNKTDTVLLKKNIEKLVKDVQQMSSDTINGLNKISGKPTIKVEQQ
jgi:cell division protein FtsQ